MDALILVDIQNDFMPFGALPVPGGDEVVAIANALMSRFGLVVATQDWHPADHSSFASNNEGHSPGDVVQVGGGEQVLWPDHCVQDMPGASFHSGLDVAGIYRVVRKGIDPAVDSYSGFFDNRHARATGMEPYLRRNKVDRIVVVGLATDYCVKFTALDGLELGFEVVVVEDGCRAVDLAEGDGRGALDEMCAAGARVVRSSDMLRVD